ncbi:MAG TPA: glycosyltransferase, partial [Bryobacteraceae bacterium]|nr:glycosyltransferase [Bryobacteraceae bacterium]
IGNNRYHSFVYDAALNHPGIVVLHESNLHHLIAERTIKQKDWDAYLREVEHEGGPEALAYARRVRALEVGPDYEGLPMLRRLLSQSKAVIVHSHYVAADVRRAGFAGPVAVIPHGAWIPEADRLGYRQKLGVAPETPLIGVFGFLKPYKRIAESLRAFKRLLRLEPRAKMVLVGEPHPDFPLAEMIHRLGIGSSVRMMGFTPIEEFTGYIAACDIVLNLRYPTVGERSGTRLRSLGLGKAVLVSDIGSFSEYPDEICLKVPVGPAEEDAIFEYLDLLVSRPEVRQAIGGRAREWVARECAWDKVAQQYVDFVSAVRDDTWTEAEAASPARAAAVVGGAASLPLSSAVEPDYILGWAEDPDARGYVQTHVTRLAHTLAITPPGSADKSILEMGAYMQITPALHTRLGYGHVRGCYYGPAGRSDEKEVVSADGEHFRCTVDLFDAERDRFPYDDESFDTVLCCELIEHLPTDPMHMMSEVNRVLKQGGAFVLTTPNICSARAISSILQGYHPGFFPAYIRPAIEGAEVEARHAREYAAREIALLFRDSGLELTLLETGEFKEEPHPEHQWVYHLLEHYKVEDRGLRGDGIYAVGVKRGPVRERYPGWLYS